MQAAAQAQNSKRWQILKRWQRNIRAFVWDTMGAEPTSQQGKILDAVEKTGAWVSVRSGHGIGKSAALAWLILWMLTCFDDVRVPCTAPTAQQMRDVLWAEVRKWHRCMLPSVGERIVVQQDRAYVQRDGTPTDNFATARTARKENPEALAGQHAPNMLYIADEASGIPEEIFQTAEGAWTGQDPRVVLTGNPTRNDGYFHRTHHKDRRYWKTLHFSSEKSALVSKQYWQRMAKRYGKNSDIYRVRVTGDFPKGGGNIVLPLDLLERAQQRTGVKGTGQRILGVDIARYGDDDSATCRRQGALVNRFLRWHGNATTESAGKIIHDFDQGGFDQARVDVIGLGAGVADLLRASRKFPVADINVGERARDEQFNRYRDELYWKGREWLETEEVSLPADDEDEYVEDFIAEACGIQYGFTPTGKIKVEDKEDVKDRIGHSPDLTDAWLNTFAEQGIPGQEGWFV